MINKDIREVSPLVLAYIGDAVYELHIRNHLVNTTNLNPHNLHLKATKYVKAKAQADILQKIDEDLTQEEKEIVRRGRNAKSYHIPKNADLNDYMYATAFECLIGYLYLNGEEQRLKEILDKTILCALL